MQNCPNCSHPNRVGELFCQDCGTPLFVIQSQAVDEVLGSTTSSPTRTKLLPPKETSGLPGANNTFGGTTFLREQGVLVFHFKNSEKSLEITAKDEMVIGRADSKSNHFPDIDLTPYGALEEGISRTHARLARSGNSIVLTDMDSVNGTYVNGQRLPANQQRILRDGDEMRLGRLVINVYFK
jgi:pSer/pThr/pTyr-binding forkhead associated (FHA) protein